MPPPPIDPLESPRYALEGRVVTMNEQFDVMPAARVYVDAARIVAVQPPHAPAPAGLEGVPILRTGGTIFPGLIELHNHLSYNALPAWSITERFTNRDQWGRRREYRQRISRPAAILGSTEGLVQAVVRYAEAKCLVSGVTTTQGIALASNNGIRRFYRGAVRNVEQTGDPELPAASTRIADVEASDAAKFRERLDRETSLLLHLSEGLDDRARGHFQALRISEEDWAITPALGGIHCCGLRDTDYATLAAQGGSMVWSPMSNLLLYGGTADIARVKREGTLVALGSDWSPSGSRNLLAEIKVAKLVSDETGGVWSSRDLAAMATINAARILKWHAQLGSIEPGKRADLVVINGRRGDPYDQLVHARETTVTLVVINGVPRCGTSRLMSGFEGPTETVRIGSAVRVLNLAHGAADPLVGGLGVNVARERLAEGLAGLPEHNRPDRRPPVGARPTGPRAGPDERWVIALDHEVEDGMSVRLGVGAAFGSPRAIDPVAATSLIATASADDLPLVAMEPDPLTVAGDSRFDEFVEMQPNLPAHVKQGLPRFYGG